MRDFLSLYALTQQDGIQDNGTWEELSVKNGEAARTALFGSGQKAGGLVTGVHIGGAVDKSDNPYRNMNDILEHLGIYSSAVDPHRHHFHVYLQPPKLQPIITNKNLLAGMQASQSDGTAVVGTSQTDAQALLDYAQAIISGEELMFIMDVPAVPLQDTPIVIVQAGSPATAAPQADYILKTCQETEHTEYNPASALRSVDPAGALKDYVMGQRRDDVDIDIALFKPSLLQGTSHGKITEGISNYGRTAYRYDPEPGFYGDDQAVFMVEFEGKRYKLIYQIKVMEYVPDYTTCPPPKLIKVTPPSSGASGIDTGFSLGSVSVSFADLEGSAVGQTVGATITLDTNAAGNGWFIDGTPWDNSEYLPTSKPNEWVAKEGTDAYGKMDLLSVLLHEYGHVLGLDHSDESHSLMSAELKPGVRHTVSTTEMNAIADHLGMGLPSDPGVPFNPLPWSTSLLFGFTRLRREATGSGIVLPPLPGSDPGANSVTPAPIYSMSVSYQEALHTGLYPDKATHKKPCNKQGLVISMAVR